MKKNIYATKININQNIFNYNIEELIPLIADAVLNSNNICYEKKNLKWVFVDTKEIVIDDMQLIMGYLCKIRKTDIITVYDDDKHDTYNSNIQNSAYLSLFLLDPINEILIIEDNSEIKVDRFINIFEKLCYLSKPEIGEIKIKKYPRKDKIDNYLKDINKIYYGKFKLIPANFGSAKGFKKLDEVMKSEKIREMDITLKNEDGNIVNDKESIFHSCVEMVKNAYGTFKIKVKYNNSNKIKKIDSDLMLFKKNIHFKENITENIMEFKGLLDQVLRSKKDGDSD